MANSIIIKFQPKGDKELLRSLQRLNQIQKQLEGQIKETTSSSGLLDTSFQRNRKTGNELGNTFSTLRSKMLLFSFAMSLGGRQLIQLGEKAARLESMERAFENLQGGTENASIALDKLRQATGGTMSNFDLFQQANNAMVLGITKNSSEMAEMFKMAQRLGRALGVNTKRSVESLITGIGRQSRMMLDNIGIVVDTEKAYEDYAKKLGTSASKLTDVEKKQAFLNATLDASRKKVAQLGEEIPATVDSYDRLAASWENYTGSVGESINTVFRPTSNALADLLDVSSAIDDVIVTYLKFSDLPFFKGSMDDQIESLMKLKQTTEKMGHDGFVFDLMDDDVFGQFLEFAPKANTLVKELTEEQKKLRRAQLFDAQKVIDSSKSEIELLEDQISLYTDLNIAANRAGDFEGIMLYGQAIDVLNQQLAQTKEALEETKLEEFLDKDVVRAFSNAFESEIVRAIETGKMSMKSFGEVFSQEMNRIIAKTIATESLKALFNLFKLLMTFANPTSSFVSVATPSQVVPAAIPYHQGGMIQSYHEGGDVPMIGQEGEFVMRRSAVESIGLENLNRMNRTGQVSGGANITFTGNVLSDSFIEEEAIPKIKDAIRRGADIGIS